MAILIVGVSASTVVDVGGTTFRALNVRPMPIEYGNLGSYRSAQASGSMTAGLAANSDIYQLRWIGTTSLGLITRFTIEQMSALGTGFTAGGAYFQLNMARAYTANGSGGTDITMTNDNFKLRASFPQSPNITQRITAGAALTAGTRALDTNPIGQLTLSVLATVSTRYAPQTVLFGEDAAVGGVPLVLSTFEGLVLRATVPATGLWAIGVSVCWTEVLSY